MQASSQATHFWAKTTADSQPGLSVRDHCLNVGCVAEALIAALPKALQALLPPGAATLAALHDVGKISPGFQAKCPAWLTANPLPPDNYDPDHAKVSQWFLQHWLKPESRRHAQWLMGVAAHHGQSKGRWIRDSRYGGTAIGPTGNAEWDTARETAATAISSFFNQKSDTRRLENPPANEAVLGLLAGLTTVADWIASDERFFSPSVVSPPLDANARRQQAAQAIEKIGFLSPSAKRSLSFTGLFCFEARTLQSVAQQSANEPGLWIIEGPMGCGKTEAALAIAARVLSEGQARGLYFALPTQTSSNRIYTRVQDFLERLLAEPAMLRLAHAASWLRDDAVLQLRPTNTGEDALQSAWTASHWFASAKRSLLAPFGVGTIDQALLGVVAAKHFFVRQFGLAGKVVVLDELHSYDLYTSTLVDELIADLLRLHCTVIVLSATLTRLRRDQLLAKAREALGLPPTAITADPTTPLPYPLLSGVKTDGTAVEKSVPTDLATNPPVRIRCAPVSDEEQAREAVVRSESGHVVLWIRNTVDEAIRTYARMKGAVNEGRVEVALLHSRFPWFRREELEAEWLDRLGKGSARRPHGAIVVATQVVEQSVDIDADFMLTDLAPTDMLLQRLGRLWRHSRAQRPCAEPEVWIYAPDVGGFDQAGDIQRVLAPSSRVYGTYPLLRAGREWGARSSLRLPDDVRSLLEATYAPLPDEPPAWRELEAHLRQRAEKRRNKALGATNRWDLPALSDEEGVQTRYSDYPTIPLVIFSNPPENGKGQIRFTPLGGDPITAREREWAREAARALQRCQVKIPAWWVRDMPVDNPAALRPYFFTRWAYAVLDGENLWLNGTQGHSAGLKYLPDRGVWCEHPGHHAPLPDYREDDHELDD